MDPSGHRANTSACIGIGFPAVERSVTAFVSRKAPCANGTPLVIGHRLRATPAGSSTVSATSDADTANESEQNTPVINHSVFMGKRRQFRATNHNGPAPLR